MDRFSAGGNVWNGCDNDDANQDNCSTALSEDEFTFPGFGGYKIHILLIYTISGTTTLSLRIDTKDTVRASESIRQLNDSLRRGAVLTIDGSTSFALADAAAEIQVGGTVVYQWTSPGIQWSDNQQVSLSLHVPQAPTPTGVELESANFLPGSEGHELVIPEGGSATFGVRLDAVPTSTVTVNLIKLVAQQFHGNLNAVTVSPTTLTFTPDNYSTLQTVTVTGVQDDDGDHEHVIVSAQIAGGRYLANGVYVTVTDSGGAAQVGIQPTSGRESGDGSSNNIPITFWLSQASTSTVTVRYRTVDGTATAGSDYTAASGTVTFAPGETRKTVNVRILDDTVEDSGETFFVELSNPSSNATITPGYTRARVEILNDETGEFTVTITDNSDGGAGSGGGGTSTPTNNNNGGGGNSGSGGGGSSGSGSSGGGGGGSSRPAPSSNAALSGLYATPRDEDGNPGKALALSPAFTPSATAYTLDVPYVTATLDIAPGLTSGTAAVGVRRDGTARPFPAAQSYRVPLPPGETTVIEVTVTAEDGQRTRTYTLTVTRAAPDTDPSLPALVVTGNDDSDIDLSPVFTPDNTDYDASLSRGIDAITVLPLVGDTRKTVTVNNVPVTGNAGVTLPGSTPVVTIAVTAEDGVSVLQYTIALQRTGLPANVSKRDLAGMALALADATSRSIARRLDNRRAAGTGPGLTARLRSLFPGTAAEPTAFDPVFEDSRVDNGRARSRRLPDLSALLQLADTAWSFDEDNPDAPGLWFEGSTLIGNRLDSAHAGFDAVTGHNLTAGAALSWHGAAFNHNNDTALAGINPYLRWTGDTARLDVVTGLGKGHFRHKDNGNSYREPVEHHYLSAAFTGALWQNNDLDVTFRSELTRAQLAVGPVTARAGRLRLAVESSATLPLPGGSTLVPSLSLGARRDHGDLAGAGAGVESGAGLAWQRDNLAVRARAGLFRTALNTEWGIGGTLDYRHPRGATITLSPSYGNAQDRAGQLWDRGLPSRADDFQADGYAPYAPRKQLRMDLRAGFAWQAPRRLGTFAPFLEARLQRHPSLRLGAAWTTPGRLDLRLAGERTGGGAGLPADNALLLELGWRPGR